MSKDRILRKCPKCYTPNGDLEMFCNECNNKLGIVRPWRVIAERYESAPLNIQFSADWPDGTKKKIEVSISDIEFNSRKVFETVATEFLINRKIPSKAYRDMSRMKMEMGSQVGVVVIFKEGFR